MHVPAPFFLCKKAPKGHLQLVAATTLNQPPEPRQLSPSLDKSFVTYYVTSFSTKNSPAFERESNSLVTYYVTNFLVETDVGVGSF